MRDETGLVHAASVRRWKDPGDGTVTALHVTTACIARVMNVPNRNGEAWVGVHLPKVPVYASSESYDYRDVAVPRFTIVEWNVREAVTCIVCIASGG